MIYLLAVFFAFSKPEYWANKRAGNVLSLNQGVLAFHWFLMPTEHSITFNSWSQLYIHEFGSNKPFST
jgi:hypothetical protein